MNLSKKGEKINASMTLALSAKANQMKADGHDVVSFGAGEPDFNTPKHIAEAGKEAIDKGFTKYTAAAGTVDLKTAIQKKFK
ncbi:MAG: aminotransferase class I/II-fold pyridoxal phosphate-dependent enzyme, partial [Bacillota bacterium]